MPKPRPSAWKQAPAIRILLPLVTGILLQDSAQTPLHWILLLLITQFAAFLLFYRLPLALRFRWQWAQGLLLMASLAALGMLLLYQKDIRHHPQWYGHTYEPGDTLLLAFREAPVERTKSRKAHADVIARIRSGKLIPQKGRLILYLPKDSSFIHLRYGSLAYCTADLQMIPAPGNPHMFDYRQWAARKQIRHQVFIRKNGLAPAGNEEKSAGYYIDAIRTRILTVLKTQLGQMPEVTGIAEALLIGYQEDLERDLLDAYSQAGVVHIIAVSGMHLGLIYWLIQAILGRIRFLKTRQTFSMLTSLLALWMFTLICGAGPSILRSAVMFSFLLLGKRIARQAPPWHGLLLSSFVLLCYDPCLVWNTGFQLSYAALAGIMAWEKPLRKRCYSRFMPIRKIMELQSVTLAAQASTLPVCLYYFHQFPTWFLPANLLAVPISSLVLFAEIGLVVISSCSLPVSWLATGIGYTIQAMNGWIRWLNSWPGSGWDHIYTDGISTICLFGIIISLGGYLIERQRKFIYASAICFLALLGWHRWIDLKTERQRILAIFDVPRHSLIYACSGKKFIPVSPGNKWPDSSMMQKNIRPFETGYQLNRSVSSLPGIRVTENYLMAGSVKIGFVYRALDPASVKRPVKTDLLLLSKNQPHNLQDLMNMFDCSLIIADHSNALWKIEQWKTEASGLPLRFHSIPEKGAFMLNW